MRLGPRQHHQRPHRAVRKVQRRQALQGPSYDTVGYLATVLGEANDEQAVRDAHRLLGRGSPAGALALGDRHPVGRARRP